MKKKKLIQTINMENIRYIRFSHFFNYCTDNKNEIKGFPKIRVKARGTR